jgi:hypothetical protein
MAPFPTMLGVTLRLHFRNRLALLYSYLFPTLFLLAFWVLYRYDQIPLVRHMGALLTVAVLGGACFGLPTTLVSERERGVWRRYRLAPVPTRNLVASTLAARYVLLLLAGLLQVVLAMALGMPAPAHPLDLFGAFTFVAFAFMGLGLVIAMLANTVPAVQALGQCVFLPMLIIGGIAVPLASLPAWAQRVSAYFPGRYAVEAIQAAVAGPGLGDARFSVLALLVIGSAGCVAGARLFRWDAQHRIATVRGSGWVAVALAAWIGVGLLGEARNLERRRPAASGEQSVQTPPASQVPGTSTPAEGVPPSVPPGQSSDPETPATSEGRPNPRAEEQSGAEPRVSISRGARGPTPTAGAEPRAADSEPPTAKPEPRSPKPEARVPDLPPSWRGVTLEHIERDLRFDRLPPDGGVVAPIAPADELPDTDLANHLEFMRTALVLWPPAQVNDPVQRARNVLFVAAVPDVFQIDPLERFVPLVVFDHLQQNIPKEDLVKILYWIALHPEQGDDSAVDQLRALKLGNGPGDMQQTRERAALYAVKLLGRLTGKLAY